LSGQKNTAWKMNVNKASKKQRKKLFRGVVSKGASSKDCGVMLDVGERGVLVFEAGTQCAAQERRQKASKKKPGLSSIQKSYRRTAFSAECFSNLVKGPRPLASLLL